MIENLSHALGGMAQDRGRARLQALVDRRHGIKSPDELRADLAEWQAAYAVLENTSAINAAMYEGSKAQAIALADALRAMDPSNVLFKPSGQTQVYGKVKSKLRLLFEAAFDKKLRNNAGILGKNPKAHRKD